MNQVQPFLYTIILYDETIPGGNVTANNAYQIAEWIAKKCPSRQKMKFIPYLIQFSQIVKNPHLIQSIFQKTRKTPSYLYLYINGHSKLYRGQEAKEASALFGIPTLYARDGSTERLSAIMYQNNVLFSPLDIKRILDTIPSFFCRTLLFLDTCHSLSLVSVLLIPPINLRIIHSSAEDEKTYQHSDYGSMMSVAWINAIKDIQPQDYSLLKQYPLWTILKKVASIFQSQILTSGPGQALYFY